MKPSEPADVSEDAVGGWGVGRRGVVGGGVAG